MSRNLPLFFLFVLIGACSQDTDQNSSAEEVLSSLASPSTPGDEAPELSHRGEWPVGMTSLTLTNGNQPDVANANRITGSIPRYDRKINVDLFYPAQSTGLKKDSAQYTGRFFC